MIESGKSNPLRHVGVGLELAGTVGIMMLLGYGIDRWLDTEPWVMLTGGMLGIVGGLYNLVKNVIQANKATNEPLDERLERK